MSDITNRTTQPPLRATHPHSLFVRVWQLANRSLYVKLLLAFLIVTLVPLVLLVFLNYRTTRAALTEAANRSLFAAASRTAVRFDAFINSNLETIGTEANLPALAEYLSLPPDQRAGSVAEARVVEILEAFTQKDPVFLSSYALLDLEGQVIIDTYAPNVGTDVSDRDYFNGALETGLPYVSAVEFSQVDGSAHLYFSSPVYHATGEPVGVLRAGYSASVLQQLVLPDTGLLGPQSFAVLLDENHLLLANGIVSHGAAHELVFKTTAPLEEERILELQANHRLPSGPSDALLVDLPDLESGLSKAGNPEPYFTTRLIGTGNALQAGAVAQMDTRPWLVAFFQPQRTFLAPAQMQARSTLLLAGVIIGGVGVVAFGMAQLLARPITRLTTMARRVAGGDLAVQVPVTSQDETGQLARAFNSMTAQLRTVIGNLEQRVVELQRVQTALQESEERYRTIFETAAVSIWEEDFSAVRAAIDELRTQGVTDFRAYLEAHPEFVLRAAQMVRVVDVNEATLQMYGAQTKEELLGALDKIMVSETLDVFQEEIVALAEGQTYFEAETINRTLQGERLAVLLTMTIPSEVEKLSSVLLSTMDITERKRAEEELKRHRDHLEEMIRERTAELEVAKERAEAASQAKSAFLASMSHELRTPLNAILGYAQILQQRPLACDVLDALRTVQRSGEHLLTLINDILDLSKIEAGRMELQPIPFHFLNFLDHIASITGARAAAKGLIFRFEGMDTLPVGVWADETRLRQVLLNLLDNAVKFTEAGQVTLRVKHEDVKREVAAAAHPVSRITFEVEDSGMGIPPDQLERIFQPFEQARDTSWTEGTGLGLAISRQLVRLMGGDIYVQSEPGRGSRFWFEVDLVTEVIVESARPLERIVTGYKGPRRTVLVADDIPSNRAVLVDLLTPLGFEIVEAVDGRQTIRLAQKVYPDLILMDRWMPDLNGFEAARQLRQEPELEGMVVVAVSASVSKEDRAQSREAGIDAFLPKPIYWPNLATLLEEYLELEWEYTERESEEGFLSPHLRPSLLLKPPPQEELAVLHDLAKRGHLRAILERAAHVENLGKEFAPFAARLRELARGFEEKQILALIEYYVEEKV